ncbi:MAG: class I SAM-dependent methyltransferase family protein [Verrucomicrobiales bacterium]|nr:class I SAM-dependent methyltransferase family protein [Verrucomicrobiales bacterium]
MNTALTNSPASAGSVADFRPHNLTRRTGNLVAKFRRDGRWHLIPIYWLMRLSDLAREAIDHSGSYRFADHLYRNRASGRCLIGAILDRVLLNTRAAQGMRQRAVESERVIRKALDIVGHEETVSVLAIPCGIPRDISRLSGDVAALRYVGMDIDPVVLDAARVHLATEMPGMLARAEFRRGDALNKSDYPEPPQDIVVSTGLGEFLDDIQLRVFYRCVFDVLRPGGVFFTSATNREEGSDYLLRAFELDTHYRNVDEVRAIFSEMHWSNVTFSHDATGLQTFVLARR